MATSQERIDELAKGLTHRLGLKKELKTLVDVLKPDENILAMAAGEYEGKQGLVVASDSRLFFYQRGMMGGKQEDFLYSRISSVQNDSGMMTAKIKIVTSGAAAEIKLYDKKRAQEFGDLVRAKLHGDDPTPAPIPAPAPSDTLSPTERLERLDALREAGVISDSEYDERRSAIIAEL